MTAEEKVGGILAVSPHPPDQHSLVPRRILSAASSSMGKKVKAGWPLQLSPLLQPQTPTTAFSTKDPAVLANADTRDWNFP